MTPLITVLALGMLVGAYWLGWNDRELKAQEDDAFRRLDVCIDRLLERQEP